VRPREQASLRCKGFIWNAHTFFKKVRVSKSTSVLLTLQIPVSAFRLATLVAGRSARGERVRGSWQNGYRLANTVTNVCGAAHFSQSAATLKSGDTGLTLNSGNAWLKKTRKPYPRESFGSIKAADRMFVCCGGTSVNRLQKGGCFL